MRGFLIGGITLNVLLIGWLLAVGYGGAEFSYWTFGVIIVVSAAAGAMSHKRERRKGCEYGADWGGFP